MILNKKKIKIIYKIQIKNEQTNQPEVLFFRYVSLIAFRN